MSKKTILITIRYGFTARNILRSEVLENLIVSKSKIIIVSPAFNEKYFKEEFEDKVQLVVYPKIKFSFFEKLYSSAISKLLFGVFSTKTITYKWLQGLCKKNLIAFFISGILGALRLDKIKFLRLFFIKIDEIFFHSKEVDNLIESLSPDLVVTTDLFHEEFVFIREAKRKQIRTVSIIKSWDNWSTKNRLRAIPDKILLWSDLQITEAMKYHFLPSRILYKTGSLNFDYYFNNLTNIVKREIFFKRINVDIKKKLIVYSPGVKLTASDKENIVFINSILESDKVNFDCHLIIRAYPKAQQDYEFVQDLKNVSYENSGKVVMAWQDNVDQLNEDIIHLINLMNHADLVIHIGSSLALDASCCNTPVIGLYLANSLKRLPFCNYARRTHKFVHNKYLSDTGAIQVARNENDFIYWINIYLEDPLSNEKERKIMLEKILGYTDGNTANRITQLILS